MQKEILGYTIEETGENRYPYILHGPRGARYGLMRNGPNPKLMFACNLRKFSQVVDVKGNGWFTDENGVLEVVNYY